MPLEGRSCQQNQMQGATCQININSILGVNPDMEYKVVIKETKVPQHAKALDYQRSDTSSSGGALHLSLPLLLAVHEDGKGVLHKSMLNIKVYPIQRPKEPIFEYVFDIHKLWGDSIQKHEGDEKRASFISVAQDSIKLTMTVLGCKAKEDTENGNCTGSQWQPQEKKGGSRLGRLTQPSLRRITQPDHFYFAIHILGIQITDESKAYGLHIHQSAPKGRSLASRLLKPQASFTTRKDPRLSGANGMVPIYTCVVTHPFKDDRLTEEPVRVRVYEGVGRKETMSYPSVELCMAQLIPSCEEFRHAYNRQVDVEPGKVSLVLQFAKIHGLSELSECLGVKSKSGFGSKLPRDPVMESNILAVVKDIPSLSDDFVRGVYEEKNFKTKKEALEYFQKFERDREKFEGLGDVGDGDHDVLSTLRLADSDSKGWGASRPCDNSPTPEQRGQAKIKAFYESVNRLSQEYPEIPTDKVKRELLEHFGNEERARQVLQYVVAPATSRGKRTDMLAPVVLIAGNPPPDEDEAVDHISSLTVKNSKSSKKAVEKGSMATSSGSNFEPIIESFAPSIEPLHN
mmetsp:Transcript_63433/g.113206  ORF Transcript_63433/g.113206 Transcript_63433/m.113206 type:complete len:571 (-) Transcript_63433:336-2048(-)